MSYSRHGQSAPRPSPDGRLYNAYAYGGDATNVESNYVVPEAHMMDENAYAEYTEQYSTPWVSGYMPSPAHSSSSSGSLPSTPELPLPMYSDYDGHQSSLEAAYQGHGSPEYHYDYAAVQHPGHTATAHAIAQLAHKSGISGGPASSPHHHSGGSRSSHPSQSSASTRAPSLPSLPSSLSVPSSHASSSQPRVQPPPGSPFGPKVVSATRRLQQVTVPYMKLTDEQLRTRRCPVCAAVFAHDDLERHHRSHFPPGAPIAPPASSAPGTDGGAMAQFVCNGVHVVNAAQYGITDVAAGAWTLNGEVRVGRYCAMSFSRRDALLRHLRNRNVPCVCDALPPSAYVEIGKPL
ncbi:hypothetical protein PHLGIDRAFT_237880 [Phlebiopsis gigantea 11061_1 CR5-6]|uniref:Uncharacterized protein n=1 Tax=Phlebiopsis gigantea (strain 11061_1 CR5-6) TaxID=745531 RepID=A0A0C3RSQ4_PHLG1|nr:hypothetical protein PHLGIDRAFT_237880 [Phlebiopsis gigantea 11061_1 CR5-6]